MEKITSTGGRANGLGEAFKQIRHKAKKHPFLVLQGLKRFVNLNESQMCAFSSGECLNTHYDYKLIRFGILISKSPNKNRKTAIENADIVCSPLFINEIVDNCKNHNTGIQILREDRLFLPGSKKKNNEEPAFSKKIGDILEDLKIREVSPDKIVERVLALSVGFTGHAIIGFSRGFAISLKKEDDGKVHVNAFKLMGCFTGTSIIH